MPEEIARTKKLSLVLHITALGIDSDYEPVTLAAFHYREKYVYPRAYASTLL